MMIMTMITMMVMMVRPWGNPRKRTIATTTSNNMTFLSVKKKLLCSFSQISMRRGQLRPAALNISIDMRRGQLRPAALKNNMLKETMIYYFT